MTHSPLEPLRTSSFAAEVSQAGDQLSLRLSGTADLRVQGQLEAFLDAVHRAASAGAVAEVGVDIVALQFINSSCLAAFVAWIEAAEKVAGPRYRICFTASKALRWQQRSLNALCALSPEVLTVFQ